jgi:glycosyltransferase involved in cell wall biosynthesis
MKVITYVTAGMWKSTGGPAESVPKMLKEIANTNKFKINLITLDGDLSYSVSDLYNYNVNIHIVKKTSSKNLYFNPAYINIFKKIIPESDIVHIQGVWLFPLWLASFYCYLYKKKLIISPRGSLSPNRLKKSKIKKLISKFFFEKRMLNFADLIHTTSLIEKDNVLNFGVSTSSFVVPNGVDIINPNCFSKRIIKTDKKICLFLGRLDPIKGLDILIQTWGKVKNDNWILVICGPDEKNYKSKLIKKIKDSKLESQIILIDPIYGEEKFNLYTQSDLFVLPSYGENFGITIAEALICGLPVITTKFTPWSELLEYNCGWFIDLNEVALTKALNEALITNKDILKKMGENGINLIKENYDYKKLSKKMIDVYSNLIYEK